MLHLNPMKKSAGACIGICFLIVMASYARAENVAVILSRSADAYQIVLDGFRSKAPFKYEIYNLTTDAAAIDMLAKQAAAGNLDLVVTVGSEATIAVNRWGTEIPVVYTMVMDSVRSVGPRVCGLTVRVDYRRQLELLHKMFPGKNRIGLVYNINFAYEDVKQVRAYTDEKGAKLYAVPFENKPELINALKRMTGDMVDLIFMVADKTLLDPEIFFALLHHCQDSKLPLIALSPTQVKAGALAAFSADLSDVGAQTAECAQTVLNTGSVSNQSPRKIIIYMNGNTQKQLGLGDFSGFPGVQIMR